MADYSRAKKHTSNDVKEFITPVQRLMDIINNRMDNNSIMPAMMPHKQQEAAEWWITMQEPIAYDEKAHLEWSQPKRLNEERFQYWKTPYADRICETLSAFYRLNHAEQMYIIDLQSQGIWWRGDSIKFMKIREKVDMNKIDKTNLKDMMKKVISKAQVLSRAHGHNAE